MSNAPCPLQSRRVSLALNAITIAFLLATAPMAQGQDSGDSETKPLVIRLDGNQSKPNRKMQFDFGPASSRPTTITFPQPPPLEQAEPELKHTSDTFQVGGNLGSAVSDRTSASNALPASLTSAPIRVTPPTASPPRATPEPTQSGSQPTLADLAIPGLVPSSASDLSNPTGLETGNVGNDFLPDSVNDAIRRRMQESVQGSLPQQSISTPAQRSATGGGNSSSTRTPEPVRAVEQGTGSRNPALDALPTDLLLGIPNQPHSDSANPQKTNSRSTYPTTGTQQPAEANSPARDNSESAKANAGTNQKALKAPKYSGLPEYVVPDGHIPGPHTDVLAKQVPYNPHAFLPSPMAPCPVDPVQESLIYRGKFPIPTQRPLIELWRPLFGPGIYPPAKNWLGRYNPVMPHFMVYGDFRTGVGINQNANGDFHSAAVRANLDMDLEITATERIHAFFQPLDRNGDYTRIDFTDSVQFVDRTDLRMDTLFFEGNAGAIWGGLTDQDGPFDLPFAFGLIPFFYQNGVWANDAAMGAAVALPSKNSPLLNWSNYDATFFWASDQVNSDAFPGDNNAAEFFGTAWFIEANDGYWEVDYAFVHDDTGAHRSYHNFSVAFTKRYLQRVSNSIRFITNFNQSLPRDQRTAEGHLLLIENSLITSKPNTLVPYFNFWYGQGRTQSLARAGIAGGILNNTGINFEADGLTGYPTLDATGVNTVGGAVGINMLGSQFQHQLILEFAGLAANGSSQFRNAPGDQYAVGMRYQKPLSNAWIFRTDHMYGFRRSATDLVGNRFELRFKF